MKVRQHIPTFFDGFEPQRFEVDSLEALVALPFIKVWQDHKGFERFMLSGAFTDARHLVLMAEYEQGKRWYVVAFLEGPDAEEITTSLPIWKTP